MLPQVLPNCILKFQLSQVSSSTPCRKVPSLSLKVCSFPTRFHSQAITEYGYIGLVIISNEPWLVRTLSVATGSRIVSFRDSVRERDGSCAITGHDALARLGDWTSYNAAHIIPLA